MSGRLFSISLFSSFCPSLWKGALIVSFLLDVGGVLFCSRWVEMEVGLFIQEESISTWLLSVGLMLIAAQKRHSKPIPTPCSSTVPVISQGYILLSAIQEALHLYHLGKSI